MRSFRFLKSARCAVRGIAYCINNERNMRIHITAMVSVILFSLFFSLSATEYAILMITIAMVISAEMVNTVSEELVDMLTEAYNPMARIAKDIAAGAVLVLAVFAVAVGVFIFWKPAGFYNMAFTFSQYPALYLAVALFIAVALIFIECGPKKIKGFFINLKTKR